MSGIYGSAPVQHVLHVGTGQTVAWSSGDVAAMASAVSDAWIANALPLLSSTYSLHGVTCTDLTSDMGLSATDTSSGDGTDSTGNDSSAGTALCISWPVAQRYRGGHCRTYVAGIKSAHFNTTTTWVSAYQTSWVTAATALRTAVAGVALSVGTPRLILVRRWVAGFRLEIPLQLDVGVPVVGHRIDSQRRRLRVSSE